MLKISGDFSLTLTLSRREREPTPLLPEGEGAGDEGDTVTFPKLHFSTLPPLPPRALAGDAEQPLPHRVWLCAAKIDPGHCVEEHG